MHGAALVFLLVGASQAAGGPVSLEQAIILFEAGELEKARGALAPLVESGSPWDRARARLYLAASHHALGDEQGAREHLFALAREGVDVEVDPVLFVPEFVALAREVKAKVAEERAPPPVQIPDVPAAEQPPPGAVAWSLRAGVRGLVDVMGVRSVGAVVHVLAAGESLEGGLRSVIGTHTAIGAELAWKPPPLPIARVGLRGTYVPSVGGGGGAFAGARVPLFGGLSLGLELGAEYFLAPSAYQPVAVTVSAGIDYGFLEVRR